MDFIDLKTQYKALKREIDARIQRVLDHGQYILGPEVRELEEKLRDTRKEIFEAGLTEKFDEDAVRSKAIAASKVEAEVMVLRAKAFSLMRPRLTADQIEKIRTAPPPGGPDNQSETPRRRSNKPRDENDLPQKDAAPGKKP